jgi:hypothetical protein
MELINTNFLRLQKRAEMSDPSTLVATFVDTGQLFSLLSVTDHQILYGRRGTGKTHALKYLAETRRKAGDIAVYVDMRNVGSTGGIHADPAIPVVERATRLLADTFEVIHTFLSEEAYRLDDDEAVDTPKLRELLDLLANQATAVQVTGTVQRETKAAQKASAESSQSAEFSLAEKPSLKLGMGNKDSSTTEAEYKASESGTIRHHIHFGAISRILQQITELLPARRLWVLLDEWSNVPMDLQPILGDFVRRCMLPVRGVTVKIGAIEHRTRFREASTAGDYLGIEVGADMSADINLDDFMVFDSNSERAKEFFREFLFRHVRAATPEKDLPLLPLSATSLIGAAFTQVTAFDEFVRATEGVPRDAMHIASIAAQRAGKEAISVSHVRAAASTFYQRDKEKAVSANSEALSLLHWIMDEVIGARKARACLIRQGASASHPLIGLLFDARVMHVVKRGVSASDPPGARFDVYALDYGCYVNLATTSKYPQQLFEAETDKGVEHVEVPADDYRSIRRAVLDLAGFEKRQERMF